MTDVFRPLPNDPGAEQTMAMFDARADDWIMAAEGSYHTAAAETLRSDGTGHQRVVILEWPGRRNLTDEHVTVRLMISPDDAVDLAVALAHTAKWMMEAEQ